MFKIEFYLKKPSEEQNKLEYITISDPKKIVEGEATGRYFCELYQSDKKLKTSIYSPLSPIDVALVAVE